MPKKKDIWKQIIQFVQSNHQDSDIKPWFSGTSLQSFSPESTVIHVPNRFVAIWIKDHFLKDIQEAFMKLYGYQPKISCSYIQRELPAPRANSGAEFESLLSPLSPDYTFESFVIDSHNKFAHAAAVSISQNPASYHPVPLVIFSSFPSGKTHLLQSIGNRIIQHNPSANVAHISSSQFISILKTIDDHSQLKQLQDFILKMDILLMDDIHHLSGNKTPQFILLSILDAFASTSKPVVFTSAQQPNLITGFEQHLCSRLQSGILAEISGLEQQTRFTIAKTRLIRQGIEVSDDIVFYLANLTDELPQLLIYTDMVARHVSKTNSTELSQIRRLIDPSWAPSFDIDYIIRTVAQYYGVESSKLTMRSKTRRICHCRHMAMYLCKEILGISLKEIGDRMGKMNHSSVLYGIKKIENSIRSNRQILQDVLELKKIITYC